MFFDYFGKRFLRADLSISVSELGSLLDHTGSIGAAERNAAHVFGADRSYFFTNGTSTANRVVITASVARGEIVVVGGNAHKSIEHGTALTGAHPAYLMLYRNHLGMIGRSRPPHSRQRRLHRTLQYPVSLQGIPKNLRWPFLPTPPMTDFAITQLA